MDVLSSNDPFLLSPNLSFLKDEGLGKPGGYDASKGLLARWREIGTTRGLKTDLDVASFLVRFFEDTWRDQQSAAMCLQCHTPLTLCCLQCSGISALPHQGSNFRARKEDQMGITTTMAEDLLGSVGLFGVAAKAGGKTPNPNDLKCPLCSVMFTEVDQLTVHVLAHSTVMTHRCNICNAAFLHPDVFELHKKIHPQEEVPLGKESGVGHSVVDTSEMRKEVKVEPDCAEPAVSQNSASDLDANDASPGAEVNKVEISGLVAGTNEVSIDTPNPTLDKKDHVSAASSSLSPPEAYDEGDDTEDDEDTEENDNSSTHRHTYLAEKSSPETVRDDTGRSDADGDKDDVTLLSVTPGPEPQPVVRNVPEANHSLLHSHKDSSYGCQRCGLSFGSLRELILHSRCHYSSLRQKFAAARLQRNKTAVPQCKAKAQPQARKRGRKPLQKLRVKMKSLPAKRVDSRKLKASLKERSDDSADEDYRPGGRIDSGSDTTDYEVETKPQQKKKQQKPAVRSPIITRPRRGRPPKLPHEKKMKYGKRFKTPGMFRCKYCGRDMCNKDSLTAHERRHTGIKPYKCPQCTSSFFSRSALWAHIRTHSREMGDNSFTTRRERPHRCQHCRNTYTHEESLREHLEEAHISPELPGRPHLPKSWVCDKCGKFYSNQKNFKAHLRRHEEGFNRVCPDCGKSFRGSSSLRSHMKLHRPGHNHLCSECGKTFQWAASLRQHKKLHETGGKGHVCNECGRTFQWAPSLAAHMKLHEVGGAFTCPICGKMFQWENTLQKHQKLHETGATIGCHICGKTFQYAKSLPRHMQRFHAGSSETTTAALNATTEYSAESFEEALASSLSSSMKNETSRVVHTCDQCGKTFEHSRSLSQHKRSHSGEKKFFVRNTIKPHPDRLRCPQCNLQCQSMAHFKRHLLTHRKENKPFECQECGKGYSDARSLRNHMQYHETGGMHACSECGKRFGTAQSLQRHQRQHDVNSGRVAGHQCPHCSRCFGDASHYRRHLMSHSKEKPFVCAICAKAYADSSALKYHNMQLHQGQHTLICEVCHKSFYCTRQLENHACSTSSDHRHKKHRPQPHQHQHIPPPPKQYY